jgi:hypothetical protein
MEREGPVNGSTRGEEGAVAALVAMLSDLQHRHEVAVARLEHLEAAEEERRVLAERAESLVRAEVEARLRADQLSEEVKELRGRLTWRTWEALAIGAGAAAMIAAVLWIRFWWPV